MGGGSVAVVGLGFWWWSGSGFLVWSGRWSGSTGRAVARSCSAGELAGASRTRRAWGSGCSGFSLRVLFSLVSVRHFFLVVGRF